MFGLHRWHRHPRAVSRSASTNPASERQLALRIRAEFREMPGLCLTLAQTARLFSVDAALATRALDSLVQAGVLCRERGLYLRANAHRKCA